MDFEPADETSSVAERTKSHTYQGQSTKSNFNFGESRIHTDVNAVSCIHSSKQFERKRVTTLRILLSVHSSLDLL